MTDLDDDFLRCCRCRSSFRFCFRLFFLAASGQTRCYGDCNRCESEFIGLFHVAESSEKKPVDYALLLAGCQRGNPRAAPVSAVPADFLLVKYP